MATPQRAPAARPGQRPAAAGKPATPKGKSFVYNDDDDPSVVSQHATAPSGAWDSFIKSGIPLFRPKEGLHTIRILPRTFDAKKLSNEWAFAVDPHWGLKVFVHRNIGPDKASYLCRRLMLGEHCNLCEERQLSAADAAALKALKVDTRYIAWIIDRKNTTPGPQIWNMPPVQVEQEICKRQEDRDTHEIVKIEHPTKGYDVEFEVKKQGDFLVFTGVSIKRAPSPVSDDPALFAFDERAKAMSGKWAEIINEMPLNEVLRFYDDAYLLQVYNGETQRADADLGATEAPAPNGHDAAEETGAAAEEIPAGDEGTGDPEIPEPEVIWEMDETQLAELCEAHGMAFDMADYDNDIVVARDALLGEFHPDWVPPEPEAEAEIEQESEPQPAPRRPAARRPAAPAAAPAKPAAAASKPAAAPAARSGATPAEQASARLAAMRAKTAPKK